ncbi:MAG: rod shape-determining protein MreD [Endomicrobium sp.]|jgi:rod shape-determining protein MreD|nr:rod shape-determining protein MreD [Endomicrobium sp.]
MRIIIFFLIFEFTLCRYINVFEFFPNFILIFIIYLYISKKAIFAQLFGFFFGLISDVFLIDFFGTNALVFTVTGYFISTFCRKFDVNNIFFKFVIAFFSNIVYYLCFVFIDFVTTKNKNCVFYFVHSLYYLKIIVTTLIFPLIFNALELIDKEDSTKIKQYFLKQ